MHKPRPNNKSLTMQVLQDDDLLFASITDEALQEYFKYQGTLYDPTYDAWFDTTPASEEKYLVCYKPHTWETVPYMAFENPDRLRFLVTKKGADCAKSFNLKTFGGERNLLAAKYLAGDPASPFHNMPPANSKIKTIRSTTTFDSTNGSNSTPSNLKPPARLSKKEILDMNRYLSPRKRKELEEELEKEIHSNLKQNSTTCKSTHAPIANPYFSTQSKKQQINASVQQEFEHKTDSSESISNTLQAGNAFSSPVAATRTKVPTAPSMEAVEFTRLINPKTARAIRDFVPAIVYHIDNENQGFGFVDIFKNHVKEMEHPTSLQLEQLAIWLKVKYIDKPSILDNSKDTRKDCTENEKDNQSNCDSGTYIDTLSKHHFKEDTHKQYKLEQEGDQIKSDTANAMNMLGTEHSILTQQTSVYPSAKMQQSFDSKDDDSTESEGTTFVHEIGKDDKGFSLPGWSYDEMMSNPDLPPDLKFCLTPPPRPGTLAVVFKDKNGNAVHTLIPPPTPCTENRSLHYYNQLQAEKTSNTNTKKKGF